jgi:hypothetical protein
LELWCKAGQRSDGPRIQATNDWRTPRVTGRDGLPAGAIAAAIAHLRRASAALDRAPMRGRSRAPAVRMDADRHADLAGSLAWPSEAPLTRG